MAGLTDEQRALIRLYSDDPFGPNEVVHNDVLESLFTELESVESVVARVWRIKAATVADWYLANVDGSFLSRNQVFDHCNAMAEFYERQSGTSGVIVSVALEAPNAEDETVMSSEF